MYPRLRHPGIASTPHMISKRNSEVCYCHGISNDKMYSQVVMVPCRSYVLVFFVRSYQVQSLTTQVNWLKGQQRGQGHMAKTT